MTPKMNQPDHSKSTRQLALWAMMLFLSSEAPLGRCFFVGHRRLRRSPTKTSSALFMYQDFKGDEEVLGGNITSIRPVSIQTDIDTLDDDDDDDDDCTILRTGLTKCCSSSSTSLQELYGMTNPLDRILIMAEGSVQLLFAAYYDAEVQVQVEYCRQVPCDDDGDNDGVNAPLLSCWDRQVNLLVKGQRFCTAHSRIRVHDENCQRLVESGKVGLGQLWQHYHLSPTFELIEAGRTTSEADDDDDDESDGGNNTGGVWRRYSMNCEALTCDIEERFVADAWNLQF